MGRLLKATRWTIGRKLMAIVAVCISLGFVVLISVQIQSLAEHSHSFLVKKNLQLTRLLAAQVAQGVRWRNPSAIEKVYEALIRDPDSTLSGVLVLNSGDRYLAGYEAGRHSNAVISDLVLRSAAPLAAGEIVSRVEDGHLIILVPLATGPSGVKVGTFGVSWSLEPVRAQVSGELRKQALLGFVAIAGLIVFMILLMNRVVTRPLLAVTETTLHLANGGTDTEIPYTRRRDEVGELARSLTIFRQNLETIDSLSEKQKDQTRRLEEALEKERGFNELQREFVAMASHEFRTPLTIIDSGAQRIERRLERMDRDQITDKIRQIRNAVQRMTTLIESVLSSASFDAGKFKVEVEQCNLQDIVAKVCRQQRNISRRHEISVDLEQLPREVMGDARLLEQVFSNLLSNAVKYAPNDPRIEVVGSLRGRQACVAISDHGVGIPEDEQARIFDRYFRATTATGIAGTGIGLNLVAQTVELHGGQVDLSSEVGRGTTFTVRLPVRKPTVSNAETASVASDPYESNPFDISPTELTVGTH